MKVYKSDIPDKFGKLPNRTIAEMLDKFHSDQNIQNTNFEAFRKNIRCLT